MSRERRSWEAFEGMLRVLMSPCVFDQVSESFGKEQRETNSLLHAQEVELIVKVVLGELGLLEQLVVELALELHDEEEHVIVRATRKEDSESEEEKVSFGSTARTSTESKSTHLPV